jgi:hypothetical protein
VSAHGVDGFLCMECPSGLFKDGRDNVSVHCMEDEDLDFTTMELRIVYVGYEMMLRNA